MPAVRRGWAVVAAVGACLPFFGALSLTRIFYVRDLTTIFWPQHVWLRGALVRLWDPYLGGGQPAYANALNQMFFPPAALLRMLLPPVIGFNLTVALPFPIAALGTWMFLRRHVSPVAATAGALVFAVSGPMVSTGNMPNLAWSVAWLPWVLWSVECEPSRRSFALTALLVALQALSGEPVTLAGTMALVAIDAAFTPRFRRTITAAACGALVAAVQLVPMIAAGRHSARALAAPGGVWSIHPLWFAEALLPRVFGQPFFTDDSQLPWIRPLNGGRDPLLYSMYLGPAVLLLAALGAVRGPRRWRSFWLGVVAAAVVLAAGKYTPVYGALAVVVPGFSVFRFPAKFVLFAAFGAAMLAARGVDALFVRDEDATFPVRVTIAVVALVGVALAALGLWIPIMPFPAARALYALGLRVGVADPVAGADFLFRSVPLASVRAELVLLAGAALVSVKGRTARAILLTVVVAELIGVNAGVNPTWPAASLGPPAWTSIVKQHPSDRFYFGGKFWCNVQAGDVDQPHVRLRPASDPGVGARREVLVASVAMSPAAWGARELLSCDLPELFPIEMERAQRMFESASRADRQRFLSRGGVRYCIGSTPPDSRAAPLGRIDDEFGDAAVYQCVPDARRAYVVPRATLEPDRDRQIARLFDPTFDADAIVTIEAHEPEQAGAPGVPATKPWARITKDADREVEVDAGAGAGGGYLVLLDAFDSAWDVEVDGSAAPLLRANGLYRAVRIAPGAHHVRFVHRPRLLYASALVSLVAAIALIAVAASEPRSTSGKPDADDTRAG